MKIAQAIRQVAPIQPVEKLKCIDVNARELPRVENRKQKNVNEYPNQTYNLCYSCKVKLTLCTLNFTCICLKNNVTSLCNSKNDREITVLGSRVELAAGLLQTIKSDCFRYIQSCISKYRTFNNVKYLGASRR